VTIRHNLMTNPAAGVDLTGWTASTCTPVRATGLTGLPRTTGVKSTGSGFFRTPTVACVPGDQFAVSFYVRNDTGSFEFGHTTYIAYTTSGHGEQFPETFVTTSVATGSSARSSKVANVALVPADATGIFLICDSWPANITLTGVLFEKAAAVDTYFDGSFANSSWDGTADLSASTFNDAPTGPKLSVWNGSAEVGATISVWNGTAEVPAVLDSVV
jgi:hypothetical protein